MLRDRSCCISNWETQPQNPVPQTLHMFQLLLLYVMRHNATWSAFHTAAFTIEQSFKFYSANAGGVTWSFVLSFWLFNLCICAGWIFRVAVNYCGKILCDNSIQNVILPICLYAPDMPPPVGNKAISVAFVRLSVRPSVCVCLCLSVPRVHSK